MKFRRIIKLIKTNSIELSKQKIKELIYQNVSSEEIIATVKTEFLSIDQINNYIENYSNKNKYLKPNRRVFNFIKGTFLILAGIWRFTVTRNIGINLLWFIGGLYFITLSRKK